MTTATLLASEAIRAVVGLGRVLPRSLALPLFGAGGALFHNLEPRGRSRARRNLQLVYGDSKNAAKLSRAVYADLGRNLVDLARLDRAGDPDLSRLVEARGLENLDAALRSGRGVVGITGHLGNWELLAAYLGRRGTPLTAFATTLFDERLDAWLENLRVRHGVRTLYRSEPGCLRRALRVLQRGEMLGLLMDLRTRSTGIETDFLGQPAQTAVGPVKLAMRTGAVILPMACWRTEDNRYRFVIDEPVERPSCLDEKEAVRETTRTCLGRLEQFIRNAPTQWVWMHDRWGLDVS